MPEFTPGLLQSTNAAQRRAYEQAQIQEVMQMMQMRQMFQQQQEQGKQRALDAQRNAPQFLPGAGGIPPTPPPPMTGQPPMPGQGSMPMQPPQGPPPPLQGAPQPGPPGGQPPPMMGPQMGPQGGPPQPPPGWMPGKTAGPDLGGSGMPQTPGGGIMGRQLIDPMEMVEKMRKAGVPGDKLYDYYQQNIGMIDASNKMRLDQAKMEVEVEKAKAEAERATRERVNAERLARDPAQKESEFERIVANQYGKGTPKYNAAMEKYIARKDAPTSTMINMGGPQQSFSSDAVELGARMYLQTGQLPSLGMGKDAVKVRGQIMQRAAELQKEGGGDLGDVASNVAGFKADAASLRQVTQRSNAIEASAKKIDKDMKTLDKYLESGTAGSVTLVNKPLNVLRTQFSDPKLNELAVAAKIVGTEYERMITGGLLSVAQLHEGAREDADKLLNLNMTPDQIRSTIKIMKQEIENQRNSWKDQIAEIKRGMKGGGGSSGEPAKPKVVNWNDLK